MFENIDNHTKYFDDLQEEFNKLISVLKSAMLKYMGR